MYDQVFSTVSKQELIDEIGHDNDHQLLQNVGPELCLKYYVDSMKSNGTLIIIKNI